VNDPVRLLDGAETLLADEIRALESDASEPSPPGAKRAVWDALAMKLGAVGAAAATGTAASSAAASGVAAQLTLGSLVKAAGVGVALGTAVSTGFYFGTPREAVGPAVVTASSAAAGSSATRRERAIGHDDPVQGSDLDDAPLLAESASPPPPSVAPENRRMAEEFPAIENESQRVARARSLLRSGDARRALAALHALERDEPRGLLVQEREALLVEALWALGQRAAARERAAAFLKRYPSSPHARVVRRALE
jgi:hypothetical protein